MKKYLSIKHSLALIVFSMLCINFLLPVLRPTMYVDGVTYAAIAKNMALGIGSIWDPYFSVTRFPHFFEHPPLAIYLESIFFRLFGQGFIVERLYSLCIVSGSLAMSLLIWRRSLRRDSLAIIYFLFLAAIIPLISRVAENNMLENTLILFTLVASYFLLNKEISCKSLTSILYLLLASVFVLLAALANGPTAFFPFCIPLLRCTVIKDMNWRNALIATGLLLIFQVSLFTALFLISPNAATSTMNYLHIQLLASITGTRDLHYIGWHHLHVIVFFIRNIWLVTLIAGLIYLGSLLIRKDDTPKQAHREALLYLLISLAASLPVIISHRQSFHYIAQSSPFYVLFLATLTYPALLKIVHHLARRHTLRITMTVLSTIILMASISITMALSGKPREDRALVHDVKTLIQFFPPDAIVSSSTSIYTAADSGAYFSRYSLISLRLKGQEHYYLKLKSENPPPGYRLVNKKLQYFNLYEKAHSINLEHHS